MKRRTVLISVPVGVAAVTALSACGGGDSGAGEGSKELQVTLSNHPWSDAIKALFPEFEEETGPSLWHPACRWRSAPATT